MRSQFKKDYKRMLQQKGCTAAQFKIVLDYLVNEKPLPEKYKDHALSNNWAGFRECHIRPELAAYLQNRKRTLSPDTYSNRKS